MNQKIIFFIFISFSLQLTIKEGVYNLLFDNYYLNFDKKTVGISDSLIHPYSYFRIKKNFNQNYYYLQIIKTNFLLSYSFNSKLFFTNHKKNNKSFNEWEFIKTQNNKYAIKNKNNCFIKISKFKKTCENIPIEKASLFNLIKIYEEVKDNKSDIEILEKEPIDILIKYIDLRDLNLKRDKIHQIEKDYDNEELKYSIRSIIKNIPWVRKIFILMPNEKVRYFKKYELIKDKIVYVKDKDLIGYDCSNTNSFLFRYWKMKNFGISNNFIVMDDDYFIGKKLKKKDFFQVEKGKVVPSIIVSKFLKVDKNSTVEKFNKYKSRINHCKEEQNDDAFNYSLQLKEIYDLVYKSEYKIPTLYSLYRENGYVQFQECYISFIFIKYKRKVKDISNKFIIINRTISANYDYSLFCINKGPYNYSYIYDYKAKIAMEKLFPIATQYEIIDNSLINISYNIVKTMEKTLDLYEEQINKLLQIQSRSYFKSILLISFFFIIFKIYSNYNFIFLRNYLIIKEIEGVLD